MREPGFGGDGRREGTLLAPSSPFPADATNRLRLLGSGECRRGSECVMNLLNALASMGAPGYILFACLLCVFLALSAAGLMLFFRILLRSLNHERSRSPRAEERHPYR